MKNIAKIFLVSALGGALTLGAYKTFFEEPLVQTVVEAEPTHFMQTALHEDVQEGFTTAAEKTVHSVVHVTTAVERTQVRSPLEHLFGVPPGHGGQPRLQRGSGSGVIVSRDGYIVTNNHVIADAQQIQVTLNSGMEYKAEVVGTDPTTDIALIKIEANDLPFLTFSNSDQVRLGEWVLAVGNPFNLTSTVTAGIVSAKSRSIGIINENLAIESFIQTDAAVNPGNSGGALVNTTGELIGINSAISTRTGSYEGYSFAVPSNIVKKVIEDILEYGAVQRAFIGVSISDITPAIAEQRGIDVRNGVYVQDVTSNGAARDAGIESGDVIIAIDGREVNKSSRLQELIGRKRPGDRVQVTVNRDGDEKDFTVELRNAKGTTDVVKREEVSFIGKLGASFTPISEKQKRQYRIGHGVVVEDLSSGILAEHGIREGFIITYINRHKIEEPDDINRAVQGLSPGESVVIQGYTRDGKIKYFAFGYN